MNVLFIIKKQEHNKKQCGIHVWMYYSSTNETISHVKQIATKKLKVLFIDRHRYDVYMIFFKMIQYQNTVSTKKKKEKSSCKLLPPDRSSHPPAIWSQPCPAIARLGLPLPRPKPASVSLVWRATAWRGWAWPASGCGRPYVAGGWPVWLQPSRSRPWLAHVVAGYSQVWPGDARRWLELARAAYLQGEVTAEVGNSKDSCENNEKYGGCKKKGCRREIRAFYPAQKVRSWSEIFAISIVKELIYQVVGFFFSFVFFAQKLKLWVHWQISWS